MISFVSLAQLRSSGSISGVSGDNGVLGGRGQRGEWRGKAGVEEPVSEERDDLEQNQSLLCAWSVWSIAGRSMARRREETTRGRLGRQP